MCWGEEILESEEFLVLVLRSYRGDRLVGTESTKVTKLKSCIFWGEFGGQRSSPTKQDCLAVSLSADWTPSARVMVSDPVFGRLNSSKEASSRQGSSSNECSICIYPVNHYHVLYVSMVTHTWYRKCMDQPGKVANPARGQLIGETDFFPGPVRA